MNRWMKCALWPGFLDPLSMGCLAVTFACVSASAAPTVNDFSGGGGQTPFTVLVLPTNATNVVSGGGLRLPGELGSMAMVLFDRTATGPCQRIVADWNFTCPNTAQGFTFHLLNTGNYGTTGNVGINGTLSATYAPEPVFTNSLSVAFDTSDSGDYQGLGQHEVSLHWNRVQRANRRTAVDYRTGTVLPVHIEVEFVPGGAEVTVKINGSAVYARYFLAGVVPYESRVALSGWFGPAIPAWVDDLNVQYHDTGISFPVPEVVRTFDSDWLHSGNRNPTRFFTLPSGGQHYARILLAMTLSAPPNGFDTWDRKMNICVYDDADTRFEIARFITPYGRNWLGWTWYVDVTDYQSLLRGSRKMRCYIDTWVPAAGGTSGSGWLVTADLLYYTGIPEFEAFKVENLWVGEPIYGNTNNPISNFFTPRVTHLDPTAERAKLHFMVTGHGSGNTDGGAEFISRGRTVTVNSGTPLYNVLWKDDCYLNPCSPQSGTWQYSRAGWAPGDRVDAWDIDVTSMVTPGQPATFEYVADEYINYAPVPGDNARHWVESQLISYRTSPLLLTLEPSDARFVLHWTDGILQAADDVTGPYTDVVDATSPWTNAPVADRQFFRLRKQIP